MVSVNPEKYFFQLWQLIAIEWRLVIQSHIYKSCEHTVSKWIIGIRDQFGGGMGNFLAQAVGFDKGLAYAGVYICQNSLDITFEICTFCCMQNLPEKNKKDLVNKFWTVVNDMQAFEKHQINEMNWWTERGDHRLMGSFNEASLVTLIAECGWGINAYSPKNCPVWKCS